MISEATRRSRASAQSVEQEENYAGANHPTQN